MQDRDPAEDPSLTPDDPALTEHALRELTLREPSAALDARVAQALAAPDADPADTAPLPFAPAHDPPAAPRRSGWLTGLAAAAVLALLAALGLTVYSGLGGGAQGPDGPGFTGQTPDTPLNPPPGPGTADPTPQVVPAGYNFREQPVQLHWSRDLDAGLLTAENAQPVRAVRRQDVEQRVWVDPERGVTVQVTRPRERLVVVKQPTF